MIIERGPFYRCAACDATIGPHLVWPGEEYPPRHEACGQPMEFWAHHRKGGFPLDAEQRPYIIDSVCPGCALDLRSDDLMDERNFAEVVDGQAVEKAALFYYDGGPRLWNFEDHDWPSVVVRCECGARLTLWDGRGQIE